MQQIIISYWRCTQSRRYVCVYMDEAYVGFWLDLYHALLVESSSISVALAVSSCFIRNVKARGSRFIGTAVDFMLRFFSPHCFFLFLTAVAEETTDSSDWVVARSFDRCLFSLVYLPLANLSFAARLILALSRSVIPPEAGKPRTSDRALVSRRHLSCPRRLLIVPDFYLTVRVCASPSRSARRFISPNAKNNSLSFHETPRSSA